MLTDREKTSGLDRVQRLVAGPGGSYSQNESGTLSLVTGTSSSSARKFRPSSHTHCSGLGRGPPLGLPLAHREGGRLALGPSSRVCPPMTSSLAPPCSPGRRTQSRTVSPGQTGAAGQRCPPTWLPSDTEAPLSGRGRALLPPGRALRYPEGLSGCGSRPAQ